LSRVLHIETLDPIKFKEWNRFVEKSPQGDIFCYTWWLDAITNSRFKILAALENDVIVAGIPLAFDDMNKVNVPPLTRSLGVLFIPQDNLSEQKKLSNQRRWLTALLENFPIENFVQMCMHHEFKDWLPFRWKGFKQTTRYTYIVNYRECTIDELYRKMSRGRKETINRAVRNGIHVELTNDFDLLYRFASLSYQRQNLEFRVPYSDLKRLDEAIVKNGSRIILKAVDSKGLLHASIYAAFNSRSAYFLLSGGDPVLRKQGGHTLVFWETIKYFSDKVAFSNFGGSDIKRIEEHLRGFGGQLTPYFHIYNEQYLNKEDGIRYHLKEALFHSKEVLKGIKNKF
jgi:hypothetical protein